MNLIEFNNKKYPKMQSDGNAAQFAIPYAKHFCFGKGYDIGCGKIEWAYPGSFPIDLNISLPYHATNLPEKEVNYIFSSHCLEHIDDWVATMEYWYSCLKAEGILFLYLPDYTQEYWRPWNNKKHKHIFNPTILKDYMYHLGYKNIFVSDTDLNNSFMIVGEK